MKGLTHMPTNVTGSNVSIANHGLILFTVIIFFGSLVPYLPASYCCTYLVGVPIKIDVLANVPLKALSVNEIIAGPNGLVIKQYGQVLRPNLITVMSSRKLSNLLHNSSLVTSYS